jgi:DNA (cytosine-5)-methyltransferase 1
LFSSAGIGELGIKANDIEIIISNELLVDRHALYEKNFPEAKCFCGDIRTKKEEIFNYYCENYANEDLFLIYATPPCQGMSSNGTGRLKHEIRQGNRSQTDERNRLIIPTMDIITRLHPRWIILENVPAMKHTQIKDENGSDINILEYVKTKLGKEYVGKGEVLSCSDYGVPQQRKRLITIYTRDPKGIEYFFKKGGTFFPEEAKKIKVTLRDAIGHLPSLDSRKGYESNKDFHPLHYVPIMKEDKYWWVSHTPESETAYNNQCVNPKCGYKGNPLHRDINQDGRWQSNKRTPIYCAKCGELLPRPSMIDKKTGKRRLIKGFHSAYRRMTWDEPARTITQNYQFEASDNKIHPDQNRVLSIYEALVIQSIIDYDYCFGINGKIISPNFFAEIIGESVPPKLIDMICKKILKISRTNEAKRKEDEDPCLNQSQQVVFSF